MYLPFALSRASIILLFLFSGVASIESIWKNETPANNDIIYPLGGELVKRLIKVFGREKFLQLLIDQTYQNATKIYGIGLINGADTRDRGSSEVVKFVHPDFYMPSDPKFKETLSQIIASGK